MKTKETIHFNGEYKNIKFMINKFDNPLRESSYGIEESEFNWTHYIYLNLDKQIKDKEIADKLWLKPRYDDKGRCNYDYYDSIINDIEFHGGCTWYSKEGSVDEKGRFIKVGCDYQHSWDTGRCYSLEYVKEQVRETIDSFLQKVSPVLKWCNGCGAYYEDVTKNGCGKCKYSKDKY